MRCGRWVDADPAAVGAGVAVHRAVADGGAAAVGAEDPTARAIRSISRDRAVGDGEVAIDAEDDSDRSTSNNNIFGINTVFICQLYF